MPFFECQTHSVFCFCCVYSFFFVFVLNTKSKMSTLKFKLITNTQRTAHSTQFQQLETNKTDYKSNIYVWFNVIYSLMAMEKKHLLTILCKGKKTWICFFISSTCSSSVVCVLLCRCIRKNFKNKYWIREIGLAFVSHSNHQIRWRKKMQTHKHTHTRTRL